MSDIGYAKVQNLYKKLCFDKIQECVKDIRHSEITYRFIKNPQEILELMNDIFDTPFWEHVLSEDSINECIAQGETFILFQIYGLPCALALVSDIQEDGKREVYQLDVEDELFLRGNGIGEKVVKILRDDIYPNEKLYGYAVSEAIKFWSRQARYYDREIFIDMEKEHFENGGSEEELYESEGLMYFAI